MLLKGLQKLTLLDFPGKMAATVFTGGCNFRCPFCHNASLVIGSRLKDTPSLSEEDFFAFLERRRGLLEGVCVSGGEPTLYRDLIPFLEKIKNLGYLVKLDTNGYRPDALKAAVTAGVVDYVAMDIKNSKESYQKTVDIPNFDISKITESVDFLMSGKVDFEFRTTLVKQFHTERDIYSIATWLRGEEKYFLQNFTDSGDLISGKLGGFDKNETELLLNVIKAHVKNAQIRG
ncbi:MAG: anaerobic ribonucleoside-triphosphate reductase activating protein [Ruminococcaceae bacterium]|nr:anaerobic ribonucleoside-triphosphate reductase activating protein [Oscillospiraceae bacterium]